MTRIFIPRFNGNNYVVFPTYRPKDDEQLKLWSSNKNLRYDLEFLTKEECQKYIDANLITP
jgi:uncharacterized lipoprotein YehR (DUF1307 family)